MNINIQRRYLGLTKLSTSTNYCLKYIKTLHKHNPQVNRLRVSFLLSLKYIGQVIQQLRTMHFITRVSRFFDNNFVTLSWIAIIFQHNFFTSLRNIQFIYRIFNDFTNEFTLMDLMIFHDSRPRIRIKLSSSKFTYHILNYSTNEFTLVNNSLLSQIVALEHSLRHVRTCIKPTRVVDRDAIRNLNALWQHSSYHSNVTLIENIRSNYQIIVHTMSTIYGRKPYYTSAVMHLHLYSAFH